MADSSGGTSDDSTDTTTTAGSSAATESGTSAAGGYGYGFATADKDGGFSSFSVSEPGDDGPDGDGKRVRHMAVNGKELTDEQRECMESNGATPPDFKGERPTREEMEAHRQKVEAAMDECGIEHPEPGEAGKGGDGPVMIVNGGKLSDEQRECMEENAPAPPSPNGERPSREDMEKMRSAMEAAMDKCGIEHPEPGDGGPRGDVVFGTAPDGETRTAPARPGSAFGGGATTQGGEYGFEQGTETGTATLTPATPRGA